MILETAFLHFQEDIGRARNILDHVSALPESELRNDLVRSSWMFGVGACDAYFCDAYVDLLSRTIRAKEFQRGVTIPDKINDLKVPVSTVIEHGNSGWQWRMAARDLMERENVLSIGKIKNLFNQYFEKGEKLMTEQTIEDWISKRGSKVRLFGITKTNYRTLKGKPKSMANKEAVEKFEARFKYIFQRRHDCIHNCDRPKNAIQAVDPIHSEKAIDDIEYLVRKNHDSLMVGFPIYLKRLGFSGLTCNRVGA
ncbi:MAG: hypothetical protein ACU0DI_04635 [Paracoccaceae bacterium]